MVEMAQKKKSQSLKILLLLPIGSKRRKRDLNPRAGCPTFLLIVDIVYKYSLIASSILDFTRSAISGVFNCLYSS